MTNRLLRGLGGARGAEEITFWIGICMDIVHPIKTNCDMDILLDPTNKATEEFLQKLELFGQF